MTQEPIKRQIKNAVAKLLKGGNTLAKERVSISRSIPSESAIFPLVNVYSLSETVERFDEAPKRYRRRMTLLVECLSVGDDDNKLDDTLEKLGSQVEALMEKDETLGGLLNKLELTSTDYQLEPDGESPMGLLALRYSLEFFTTPYNDEDGLSDLNEVDLDWKVGHNNETAGEVVDAKDKINLTEGT